MAKSLEEIENELADQFKRIDDIAFYNQKRPHTTLNLQTPEQYEDAFFRKQ